MLSSHGQACKVIVRRAKANQTSNCVPENLPACRVKVKCSSAASKERTSGESGSSACANNSTKHIQSVLLTEMLQK